MDDTDIHVRRQDWFQGGKQVLLQLDRHHLLCRGRQVTRQASQAGTDLQYGICGLELGGKGDLFEGNRILQEILSQPLVRLETILFEQISYIERGNIVHGQKGIISSAEFSGVPPMGGHVPSLNWATYCRRMLKSTSQINTLPLKTGS